MRLIQIIQDPSVPTFLGKVGHSRQKKTAQEIPNSQTSSEIGSTKALHPLRRLIVEKLDFRHFHEIISHSHQRELREKNEDGERNYLALLHNPIFSGDAQSFPLRERRRNHDDDVEKYAYAHPLQQRDASGVFGVFSEVGYKETIVDYNGDEHEDCDEGAEGCWRDLEMGANAPFESRPLLHE